MPFGGGGSGGGGGSTLATVLLQSDATDIHAVGTTLFSYTSAFDNTYFQNPIGAVPSGLGLTVAIDGSSPFLTATVTGAWAYKFALGTTPDANIRGRLGCDSDLDADDFGPVVAHGATTSVPMSTGTVYIPSGGVVTFLVSTDVAAAANPYTAQAFLALVRVG